MSGVSQEGVAGPRSLRHLLDAVIGIGSDLDLTATLQRIVDAATDLADARYGALGVLDEARASLMDFITSGLDADARARIGDLPKGHGILGLLIADPRPLRLADLGEHPDSFGFPPGHPPMTSFLGVPVVVRGEVFGNLYLTDKRSGEVFTDVDEELVVALATAAGVAVDERLHARVRDVVVVEDRERIAMDLHDTVIQQLFAIGLSLQGTARRMVGRPEADRLEQAVDELDGVIRRIRSTIFALSAPPAIATRGVRERVLEVVAELRPVLGIEPRVLFDGPVDLATDAAIAEEVGTVLREALTNVARHAHASHVDVNVSLDEIGLVVVIADDGVGLPADQRGPGRGLPNLRARAERRGGTFTAEPGPAGGTRLTWRTPRPG